MRDLQSQFDDFIETISLGKKQMERIESAFAGVQEHLCHRYGVTASEVFIQGSVANGTAVKPLPGGEYDLDIVLVVPAAEDLTADQALNDLQRVLEQHGRYKGKVHPKKPCVRIEYADDEIGGFHIDVVPARVDATHEAPLQAPRRGEGWHGTAPREYTAWCLAQGEGFQRSVKALKRWRDEHQEVRNAVKSIVLQVLVSRCMPPTAADDARLATTFTELLALLAASAGVPEVLNPVLPSEDLAKSWAVASFNSFKQEVATAEGLARSAVTTSDEAEAAALWVEILGDDFPLVAPVAAGLMLGDFSHAKKVQDEGWYENLDPSSKISVQAEVLKQHSNKRLIPNYAGDRILLAGWRLKFTAVVDSAAGGAIWWQVVNTGAHARERSGLRGEFFKGRDLQQRPSTDQRINWESSSYTGTHWVEAFLVRGSAVVARSGPLYVHIKNPRRQFGRW